MNPLLTPVNSDHVAYHLTDEDRKRFRRIKLMQGAGELVENGFHEMCIMQAVSVLTTEAAMQERLIMDETTYGSPIYRDPNGDRIIERYSDHPICVSEVIANAMIEVNDRDDISHNQRNQLRGVVEDILNTCPVRRKVKTYKTVPDKITESRDETAAYLAAEDRRKEILRPVTEGRDGERIPVAEAIRLIRQAADLYRTTEVVKL